MVATLKKIPTTLISTFRAVPLITLHAAAPPAVIVRREACGATNEGLDSRHFPGHYADFVPFANSVPTVASITGATAANIARHAVAVKGRGGDALFVCGGVRSEWNGTQHVSVDVRD